MATNPVGGSKSKVTSEMAYSTCSKVNVGNYAKGTSGSPVAGSQAKESSSAINASILTGSPKTSKSAVKGQ